jgi:hypothetical protein
MGSPMHNRVFSERKESRDFIFADPLDYYITSFITNSDTLQGKPYFFDTKIPYTQLAYTFHSGDRKKEERLKGLLTWNFGKRINVGGETDYIYSRGHYPSNGNKSVSYRLFGSYVTDKYQARGYVSNYYLITAENGGLTDDTYITDPSRFTDGRRTIDSKAFPVRMQDVFNTVREKQYHFSQQYHSLVSLGHTFSYTADRRHFTTASLDALDACYPKKYASSDSALHDRPSSSSIHNTFSLSLVEGFRDWVKFGLTAFVRFERRRYAMADMRDAKEFSTYLGGQWAKRRGRFLTYNARGEVCLVGDDLGEFRLTGDMRTAFPLWGKEAFLSAEACLKNVTPAFFLRRYRSRYFAWDNAFDDERQAYVGGTLRIAATSSRLNAGIHTIRNHVYIGFSGYPDQYTGNIQVLCARLAQSFRAGIFGWDGEIIVQHASKDRLLPLPLLCAYSNTYIDVKPVPVLSLQLGFDVHYFSRYDAPYYEPATMTFRLQADDAPVAVGDFPLVNAYANFHLKQTRFFISTYNLASLFLSPDYFSLPHYPLTPFVFKFGLLVHFND